MYVRQCQINEETRQETQLMMTPGFPYWSTRVKLNEHPDRGSRWHWHSEVEFFYVRRGTMKYYLPGGTYVFREGEAGFINSNMLHMSSCSGTAPVVQEVHIFLPSLISGLAAGNIETRYIRPVLRAGGLEIVRIQNAEAMIDRLSRAHEAYTAGEEGFEFEVRALMSEAWMMLFRETREQRDREEIRDTDDDRIKAMLNFIAGNYARQVGLEEIAAAGDVCKRECLRIFKRKLATTPVDYLIWQRITRAAELLRSTDVPVMEVAAACGFTSSSYFGKMFRERMGMTPKEYRGVK